MVLRLLFLTIHTAPIIWGAGEGYEYMIDIFDKIRSPLMIQKAKEISDCIIFVAHWGTEDETMPNEYEKQPGRFSDAAGC